MRALGRWRVGLTAAAVSALIGAVRLVATGATGWSTWAWFVIAAVYAFVALVARRLVVPERPQDWLGRPVRRARFAMLLTRSPTPGPGGPARADDAVVARIRYLHQESEGTTTRNRVANAVVTLAAVVGLVLVITGRGG